MKDEAILDALYFATRNTLVAKDIREGSNIAFNSSEKHRVVTLKGELIELTGIMSGGGRPRKGLMSSKIVQEFTDDQISSLEHKLQQTEKQLEQHRLDSSKLDMESANISRRF